MALLGRDAILAADDLVTQDVDVPEWGGTVRVRALTGAQRDKLEQSAMVLKGKNPTMNLANFRGKLVAAAVIDESGHPLFGESDVKTLGNKSAQALERVANVASKLAGMSPEDIQELTEDFSDDPSGDSISD